MTPTERKKKFKDNPDEREKLFIRGKDFPEHKAYIEMAAWCYSLEQVRAVAGWLESMDRHVPLDFPVIRDYAK